MIKGSARITFDGICREELRRDDPAGYGVAAWLACNPSTADATADDPSSRRTTHFSRRHGCASHALFNMWSYRATYPADLWKALADARYTRAMSDANKDAVLLGAINADLRVVAFGAEPWRRFRSHCLDMCRLFSLDWSEPLYCLGTTDDNAPLHPLARGKHAIPNDRALRPWQP